MTPMLVQSVPDRDSAHQGARKQAQSGLAGNAFDGEIRGAERRASGTSNDLTAASPVEPADVENETAREAPREGTDVVGLLAALGGMSRAGVAGDGGALKSDAVEPGRSPRAVSKGEGAMVLPGELAKAEEIDAPSLGAPVAGDKSESSLGARARLKIAHQETHFEPTMREGVLVADEARVDEAPTPRVKSDRGQLLQLLASSVGGAAGDRHVKGEVAFDGFAPEAAPEAGDRPLRESGSVLDRPTAQATIGPEPKRWADVARLRPGASVAQPQAETAAARAIEPVGATSIEPSASASAGVPALSTQVASRIVDAFSGVFSGGSSFDRPDTPTTEAQLRLRAGGSVLKTLTIQLQPEHLGTLNISMSLKDGQLTLEMAANRVETARLLTEDRGALRSILEKAGFSIDEAAIAIVGRDGPSLPSMTQGARGATDGSNPNMARTSDQPANEGRGERNGEEPQRRRQSASVAPARTASGDRAAAGVFL